PDEVGVRTYETDSNFVALKSKKGSLTCTPARGDNHGPVSVRNTRHFAYADGTAYFPFGTTCYAWTHQPSALQQETLATLKTAPFNKLRMCVFPKSYEYNHNDPEFYPFERD